MKNHMPFSLFPLPVLAGFLVLVSMSCPLLSGGNSANPEQAQDPVNSALANFEEAWQQELDRLEFKNVNCNSKVENEYKTCLQDEMDSGKPVADAISACAAIVEGLPENDKGGVIKILDNEFFYRDTFNTFMLSYPSGGGPVVGSVNIFYDDTIMVPCQVEITYVFTGQYELATCQMSGTGAYQFHAVGTGCLGTKVSSYQANWHALLQNGLLTGLVENSAISFIYDVRK